MSKRQLELKRQDWRESRNKNELTPEKLFSILASIEGEQGALEK